MFIGSWWYQVHLLHHSFLNIYIFRKSIIYLNNVWAGYIYLWIYPTIMYYHLMTFLLRFLVSHRLNIETVALKVDKPVVLGRTPVVKYISWRECQLFRETFEWVLLTEEVSPKSKGPTRTVSIVQRLILFPHWIDFALFGVMEGLNIIILPRMISLVMESPVYRYQSGHHWLYPSLLFLLSGCFAKKYDNIILLS